MRGHDLELGAGTARLGNQVVELEGVAQRFGDHTVFEDVDLLIEPGAGSRSSGRTGRGSRRCSTSSPAGASPSAGVVKRGKTVVVGFADQHSSDLPSDAIVRKLVAGPHREPDFEDRALLERFWFDTTAQYAPVRMLSGGERRRLQLVMVLATQPNLLILDEPTNDLDLDTLRSLEAFLDDWPGALVVASHDRAFLDRVADHVLAIDPPTGRPRADWYAASRAVLPVGWPSDRARRPNPPSPRRGCRNVRTARPPPRERSASSASGPSKSTVNRQMRETEKAMALAQGRVERLTAQLTGESDHAQLAATGAELTAAQNELDALESRWLELADIYDT